MLVCKTIDCKIIEIVKTREVLFHFDCETSILGRTKGASQITSPEVKKYIYLCQI
jgi:hypothetical protein